MSGGGNYMTGPDGSVSVPFSDDNDESVRDEELITDEDKPGESPEERKTRRQKRQERLQLKLQKGKAAEEELERERAEKQELRERLARLEGAVIATQRPANDAKDPYEAELDAIYAEQQSQYAAAQAELKAGGGNMPADRVKHYERIGRDIETRRARVHARREIAMTEPIRQQSQAQQQWVNKYPEVYGNERAFAYAQGRYQTRKALGEAITNEVVDEIMNETRVQFKLGGKPAPTVSERARMSGTASSGGGGGSSKEPITLSRDIRRIARAAYDDLPEEEAIKKWTAKTGKRMRAAKLL
jgi:hypothetical protein